MACLSAFFMRILQDLRGGQSAESTADLTALGLGCQPCASAQGANPVIRTTKKREKINKFSPVFVILIGHKFYYVLIIMSEFVPHFLHNLFSSFRSGRLCKCRSIQGQSVRSRAYPYKSSMNRYGILVAVGRTEVDELFLLFKNL